MNENVYNLVQAIKDGNALETENAFSAALAEKLSGKMEVMRQEVAQSMFTQPEEVTEEVIAISEEEYNDLTEEEQNEYEIIEATEPNTIVGKSPKSFAGAVKQYMRNSGNTTSRYDASRKQQATAKKRMVIAKKVIKKAGGDMNKVKQRADDYEDKTNSY
jgi:hypothetical protein